MKDVFLFLVLVNSLSLVTIGAEPFQTLSLSPDNVSSTNLSEYPPRKALVRYDYNAKDSTELSVLTDEVILVRDVPDIEPDFLMGERGTQTGKVPKSVLELF